MFREGLRIGFPGKLSVEKCHAEERREQRHRRGKPEPESEYESESESESEPEPEPEPPHPKLTSCLPTFFSIVPSLRSMVFLQASKWLRR